MKTKLVILVACVIAIAVAYSEPKKSDSDALQGTWQGTEKDASVDGHSYLTITGTNLSFVGADTNEWYKGTFTLHESTEPKQFVGYIKDCPSSDCIGVTIYAIYSLKDGKFTIAANAPGETNFPSTFDSSGTRQIVFERKVEAAKSEK